MNQESLQDLFQKFEEYITMNEQVLVSNYTEDYHTNDKSAFISRFD